MTLTSTSATFPNANYVNIVFTGLGGQGIIFLTRLFARVATILRYNVIASETHGMSQRGGIVVSHLKIGNEKAPLIQYDHADLIIALDRDEALRCLPYLRAGGALLIATENSLPSPIIPYLSQHNIKVFLYDISRVCKEHNLTSTYINTVMAGVMLHHLPVNFEMPIIRNIINIMSPGAAVENIKALTIGAQLKIK